MALSTVDFDSVRELLNHRADEGYAARVSKNIDAIANTQNALQRVKARFSGIEFSPYMNSAIKNLPQHEPAESETDQSFHAA